MNHNRSQELFERSKKIVPGGVHSPVRSFRGMPTTPVFIQNGQGAMINDVDGNNYIDFCMSFGPLILGHAHPQVREDLTKALERGWTFGACEEYSLQLAEFIVDAIPEIDSLRFVNSGTEAVMTAIRLARGFTGRPKIVKFDGCYHGHCDSMLIKAGSGVSHSPEASSAGVPIGIAQDTIVLELGDEANLQAVFEREGDKIAAIIIEPLPANNGLLIQDNSFLQALRKITQKHGALLIFDEVISGFRIGGLQGMSGQKGVTGIVPDLITYGKIIGGGLPVGAVGGRKDIMNSLSPLGHVYQAGTLSANPLAMVAGLSTLKQLTPAFYAQLKTQSQKVIQLLQKYMAPHQLEVLAFDSLFWVKPLGAKIVKASQIPSDINQTFAKVFGDLLNRGVYLAPNGYEVGFVSFAHDEEVLQQLEQRLSPNFSTKASMRLNVGE